MINQRMTDEQLIQRYKSYSTSELVRGATAPRLRTEERIRMLDEIQRREKELTPGKN